MNGRISWSRPEDVERLELKAEGVEFSHRLITKDLHGSSFSFGEVTLGNDENKQDGQDGKH